MINSFPTVHETFLASETYHRICHLEEKVHCYWSKYEIWKPIYLY